MRCDIEIESSQVEEAAANRSSRVATAVAVVAVPVWQSVQAQGPTSGVQLELVNQDEDWIERKKHGEFRARPMFNQQLSTLYYGIRDADTGEWLTGMYRVSGGEQERDEGWEYEIRLSEPLDRACGSRPRPRSTPSSRCTSRAACWAVCCARATRRNGRGRSPAG